MIDQAFALLQSPVPFWFALVLCILGYVCGYRRARYGG
jgi:hypothetical protein